MRRPSESRAPPCAKPCVNVLLDIAYSAPRIGILRRRHVPAATGRDPDFWLSGPLTTSTACNRTRMSKPAARLDHRLPLTRAMKGTSNPQLWELVNTMTDHAHAGGTYLDQDIAFHPGLLAYLKNLLMHQLVAAMWSTRA